MNSFCRQCKAVLPVRLPGKAGRNQLYCSHLCRRIFKGYIVNVERSTNCWYCQAPLVQSGLGNPRRYCSRKHAGLYRQAHKPKKPIVAKFCLHCGKSFISNLSHQKFCSDHCRISANAKFQKIRWRETHPRQEFYEYSCDLCDAVVIRKYLVTKGGNGRFCDTCRVRNRRARNHIKTVRRQSLTVKPSRLSCDEIAERDNFVCHICSGLVDMSLPRTSGLGATVDHVIPLSKGGSDEPDNLRLAHWVCNVRKGSKVYG